MGGQSVEAGIVAHKQPGQGGGQYTGQDRQGHAADGHQQGAFPQEVFQLTVVLRAVVEADHRRAADGVADEDGYEDELDVHQNAVGGDAVLADQAHELEVVEHTHQGGGDVAHQLGGAVAAGLENGAQTQCGGPQAQQAGVGTQEVDQGQYAAHTLAQAGGDGCAGHAPVKNGDEERVQGHVGDAGGHGDEKAQAGLFGGDKEALEHVLQHEGEGEAGDDAAIENAVGHHGVRRAQQTGHGGHGDDAHGGQHCAQQQCEQYQHGEGAVGLLLLALAQQLGHQGGAAGADHKAHAAQDHHEGHDQVYGGKGRFTHEIGYEQTVHHAVDGREDHHADRRKREAQQLAIREMVGETDGLLCHGGLLSKKVAPS